MDIEVKPKDWTTDNRVGFNNYIYKTFNRNKYVKDEKNHRVLVIKILAKKI